MLVNEVSRHLDITPDTVRFYTRINLLHPQKNPVNGYREYNGGEVRRLRFILSARKLGFSIEDIEQVLAHADHHESPCPIVRRLIEQRLQELQQQLEETIRLRDRMCAAVRDWGSKPDGEPDGHMVCHLIENFSNGNSEESQT